MNEDIKSSLLLDLHCLNEDPDIDFLLAAKCFGRAFGHWSSSSECSHSCIWTFPTSLSKTALQTAVSLFKEGQLGTGTERHPECGKTSRFYREMYLYNHSPPLTSVHTHDQKKEHKFDTTRASVIEIMFFSFLFSFLCPISQESVTGIGGHMFFSLALEWCSIPKQKFWKFADVRFCLTHPCFKHIC